MLVTQAPSAFKKDSPQMFVAKRAGLVTPCKLTIVGYETNSLDKILDFWRAKDDSKHSSPFYLEWFQHQRVQDQALPDLLRPDSFFFTG